MTSAGSPLLDYYPQDFEVDANGKKNAWECVVKIPFINEDLLLDAVSGIDHSAVLTDSEKQRNTLGMEHRFKPNGGTGGSIAPRSPGGFESVSRWGNALTGENNNFTSRKQVNTGRDRNKRK
jgi:5'-3' exoribonuclease 1